MPRDLDRRQAERERIAATRQAEGDAARAALRERIAAVSPGLSADGLEAAVDAALADAARAELARQLAEKRRLAGGVVVHWVGDDGRLYTDCSETRPAPADERFAPNDTVIRVIREDGPAHQEPHS